MASTATVLEGGKKKRTYEPVIPRTNNWGGPVSPLAVDLSYPGSEKQEPVIRDYNKQQEPAPTPVPYQTQTYIPAPTPAPAPAPAPVQPVTTKQGQEQSQGPTQTQQDQGPTASQRLYDQYLEQLGQMPTYNYGDFSYQPYKSAYDSLIDAAVKKITDWNYDPEKDTSYQAYKQQYTNAGQTAQEDALARLAARTGGIANSYAVSAAQQQYNNYMQELAGKIPELEQLAYQKAQNELNNYRDLDQDAYTKYLNDRTLDYNTWVQGAANAWNEYQSEANAMGNRLGYYQNRIQSEEGKEAEERAYTRQKETEERQYNRQQEAAEKDYQRQVALKNLAAQLAMQEQAARYGYQLQLQNAKNAQAAAAAAAAQNSRNSASGSMPSLEDLYKKANGNIMVTLDYAKNSGYSDGNLYSLAEDLYYSDNSPITEDEWNAIQQRFGANDWTSLQKRQNSNR